MPDVDDVDLVARGARRTAADFMDAAPYIADDTFDPVSRSTGTFLGAIAQGGVVNQDEVAPVADPLAFGKGLTGVGLMLGGLGSLMKAGAERAQGARAKAAADLSADFSERAAADAVQRGLLREYEVAAQGSRVIAEQRAQSSTGSLDVNVGAQRATEDASEANLRVSRAIVQRNAALEAYGLRQRAQVQRQQGEYEKEAADSAATGTFLSGIADFIKVAGPIAAGA